MRADRLMLLLAALLLAAPAWAEPPEEEEPSMELLEFLGDFETADGEWLDPTDLESSPSEEDEEAGGDEK